MKAEWWGGEWLQENLVRGRLERFSKRQTVMGLALLSFLSFFASPCGHQIDADPRAGPDRSSYLIDLGINPVAGSSLVDP
jgi:hypothetical protein